MKILSVLAFSGLVALNFTGCFSVNEDIENGSDATVIETPTQEVEDAENPVEKPVINGKDYFNGNVDASSHDWYVSHLIAMEEGPLDESEPLSGMKFRFLWLRSSNKPYAVRGFRADDGKIKLHMKSNDGAGGFEPGKKQDDVFVHLTPTQSDQIMEQLEALKICEPKEEKPGGMDGAQWVFEYFNQGEYCMVDIWSPDESSIYYAFGINLLKTTRVKTWEIDVY